MERSLDLDGLVARAREAVRAEGVPVGARLVLTMGYPGGEGRTNMVLVVEA